MRVRDEGGGGEAKRQTEQKEERKTATNPVVVFLSFIPYLPSIISFLRISFCSSMHGSVLLYPSPHLTFDIESDA